MKNPRKGKKMGTLAVSLILAGIVVFILKSMITDSRKGKHSCGGSCGCCPMGGKCHNSSR
jgi:hypothetical protein